MKNVGIIGIGYWGKNIIREMSKFAEISYAYSEGNLSNRKWLCENYPKIKWTNKLDSILTDPTIDAVIISSPIQTHFSIALNALKNGKHVFVEKPLTTNSKKSKKLLALAQQNNLNLFVGHIFLFNQVLKKIKELTKNDTIQETYLDWRKFGTFDDDIYQNLLTHDLSIALELSGQPLNVEIIQNRGIITRSDIISVDLKFSKNKFCNIHINRISNYKKKTVTILTKKNLFLWDDDVLYQFNKKKNEFQEIYNSKETPLYLECKEFISSISKKLFTYDSSLLAIEINKIIEKIERIRK